MRRLNEEISEEKEMELLEKLFNEVSFHNQETMGKYFREYVERMAEECVDCCEGKDGKTYFWLVDTYETPFNSHLYDDESNGINACIDMDGNIYEGDDVVCPMFGMTWSEESQSWW